MPLRAKSHRYYIIASNVCQERIAMKKDFNFVLYACIAAVILAFLSLPGEFIPRKILFSEDNPLNDTTVESEVFTDGLE